MKLVAVHLSDLHIKSPMDVILSRGNLIIRAAHSVEQEADAIFIIVTGDITYAGTVEQFNAAHSFIKAIAETAGAEWRAATVAIALCPGNHDCDLSGSQAVRDVLLQQARLLDSSLDNEIVKVCCDPLGNYFSFARRILPGGPDPALIYGSRCVAVGELKVEVRSINTPWISQLSETQGSLGVPMDFLPAAKSDADLVLTLFHHPYNWLEATNSRQFRKYVEASSDAVFTGHEHDGDAYTRVSQFDFTNADYYEGACLQGHKAEEKSGFNVVSIDVANARRRIHRMEWRDSLFVPMEEEAPWLPFLRNEGRIRHAFAIREDHYAEIMSPGASFTHPRKSELTIRDIFIHPNLREVGRRNGGVSNVAALLGREQFWAVVRAKGRLLILGEEVTGKTTLARHLYLSLHEVSMVPLLVNGGAFEHSDNDRVMREIRSAFRSQYHVDMYEEFRQLPRDRRVLLLDNFHQLELSVGSVRKIVSVFEEFFGKVVIFSSDISLIKEVALEGAEGGALGEYDIYQMLEFGNELREELIERWLYIGQDERVEDAALEEETVRAKRQVDGVLGRNLVPSYPLFILILMQQIEANSSVKTANASEGYLYEALITRSLLRSAGRLAIDTAYAYLAVIAERMYGLGRQYLTDSELTDLHERYCHDYQLDITREVMDRALIGSDVLKMVGDRYRFKYGYFYYYFLARHFRDRLSMPDGAEALKRLVEQIHLDESAQVLAFLTYLSKDRSVIEAILDKAKSIFAGRPLALLENDAEFFTGLLQEVPKRIYEDRPTRETRRELNRAMDEMDQAREVQLTQESSAVAKDEIELDGDGQRELNEILQLNVAFKTLQILGQVIRNFPGSLLGDHKAEIAHECYALGLRSLSMLLSAVRENEAPVIEFVASRIGDGEGGTQKYDRERAEKEARRAVAWVVDLLTTAVVQRVSGSVGSESLRKTFESVRKRGDSVAFDLIDVSIKLDHFSRFPQEEIEQLVKRASRSTLAMQVLRGLAVNHFYRFPRDREVKQACCGRLGLEYRKVARLEQSRRTKQKRG